MLCLASCCKLASASLLGITCSLQCLRHAASGPSKCLSYAQEGCHAMWSFRPFRRTQHYCHRRHPDIRLPVLMSMPAGASTDPAAQFAHVCATVLQQSHLCPLPLDAQPVFWQHDAGLHLYPVPDALVIADSAPMMSHTFAACACMNPVRALWLNEPSATRHDAVLFFTHAAVYSSTSAAICGPLPGNDTCSGHLCM